MQEDDDVARRYAALCAAGPHELLGPLVAQDGGELREAALEDVGYRPQSDAYVRWAATVLRGGMEAREGWVLHAAPRLPEGSWRLESPAGPVAAWRVRDDPGLPGLRPALDRVAVAALLDDLGVPPEGLELELLAYRPLRRAVVRAQTPGHRLFLKVVTVDRVADLHTRHVACAAAGLPVPRSLGHDDALGLLVLSPVEGEPLREQLFSPQARPPEPAEVVDLLDRFSAVALDLPTRSPLRAARGHGAVLAAVLPSAAGRVTDLVAAVRVGGDAAPTTTVHGDFYDDQVLVRDGRVAGVVDVDGAGRGTPEDDPANLLAHLLLLRRLAPGDAAVQAWAPAVARELTGRRDPEELRRRTAAVLLGLSTWPHSVHEPGWERRTEEMLDLVAHVLEAGPAAVAERA